MTSRDHARQLVPPTGSDHLWLLFISMLLYSFSLIKFYARDPLSFDVGPQGKIEGILVLSAFLVLTLLLPTLNRRFMVSSTSVAFIGFGVLAAISSWMSYDPRLSFVKATILLLVCGLAILASSAYSPTIVLQSFFYSTVLVLLPGFLFKAFAGQSWFDVDEYSGRSRLTLYALHPGTLADLCALVLLASFLLPKRPPLILQIFLFGLNVATGSRASSAILVSVLLVWLIHSLRLRQHFCVTIGTFVFFAASVIATTKLVPNRLLPLSGLFGTLYGHSLAEDFGTMNGRVEVWHAAIAQLSHGVPLGYGLDGARDALIACCSWDTGNAHNALLELLLSGGVLGTTVFIFGWFASARRAWLSRGNLRIRVLGIYAYMVLFGVTAPNLTYLQYLSIFLIIVLDSMVGTRFVGVTNTAVRLPAVQSMGTASAK